MQILKSEEFLKCYLDLSEIIRKKTDKALLLLSNPYHPSLRTKKLQGVESIWYARIDKNYRFTFKIEGSFIILRQVGYHDDVIKNP